jgi:hypothetical protein
VYGHGALGGGRAVVDGGGGGVLVRLECGDLGLLRADHVEEAVLCMSVGTWKIVGHVDTHHLAFLLVLNLLMQLAQARSALMVRTLSRAPTTGGGTSLHLHLSRCWQGRVVEVEVDADAGAAAGSLDFSPHATGRGPARLLILDAGIHGGGGG